MASAYMNVPATDLIGVVSTFVIGLLVLRASGGFRKGDVLEMTDALAVVSYLTVMDVLSSVVTIADGWYPTVTGAVTITKSEFNQMLDTFKATGGTYKVVARVVIVPPVVV